MLGYLINKNSLIDLKSKAMTILDRGIAISNPWVKFDYVRPTNSETQAKNIQSVNTVGDRRLLERISRWKTKAQDYSDRLSSNHLYFTRNSIENDILEGQKIIITGRKGSGKTAMSEYFKYKFEESHNNYNLNINYSDDMAGPLNEVIAKKPETTIDWYKNFWLNTLWLEMARLLLGADEKNKNIKPSDKILLKKALKIEGDIFTRRNLANLIIGSAYAIQNGKLPDINTNESNKSKNPDYSEMISEIEEIIIERMELNNTNIYIFIDELDREVLVNGEMAFPYDVIAGLIDACLTLRSKSNQSKYIKIKPVIMLRDDVFAKMPARSDFSRWREFSKQIEWTIEDLFNMVGYRFYKENLIINQGNPSEPSSSSSYFEDNWLKVFDESIPEAPVYHKTTPATNKKQLLRNTGLEYPQVEINKRMSIYSEITMTSFRTPRDILFFIQTAASYCLNNYPSASRIDRVAFDGSKPVSLQFLADHFRSEMSTELDAETIDAFFEVITEHSGQTTHYPELIDQLRSKNVANPEQVVKTLYKFSAVGIKKPEGRVFSYLSSAPFPACDGTKIVIHNGLWQSGPLHSNIIFSGICH